MTPESTDVGVIVVTYNSADDIAACLVSIPIATSRTCQTVVVDNASTDKTRGIIRDQFPDARLIANPENRYYAAANNQGLEHLNACHVLLLNPDVVMSESAIDALAERLEDDPGLIAVAPRLTDSDRDFQPSLREFPGIDTLWYDLLGLSFLFPKSPRFGRWRMGYFDGTTERDVDQPMASCILIRGEALERLGLFDERYPMFFNDVDWCRRVRDTGGRIRYIPDIAVRHKCGASTGPRKIRMIWMSHTAYIRYLWQYEARGVLSVCAVIFSAPFTLAAALGRSIWWSVRGIVSGK